MKTRFYIILLCLAGFAFCVGCEKATIQSEQTLDTSLQYRGDCDACPDAGECCCFVKLHPSTSSANLIICGSATGTTTCTRPASGGCPAFNGITYNLNLSSGGPSGLPFCALVSGPFWIFNDSGFEVRLIISCQADETNGEEIIINLGIDGSMYFENNGDCEITPC
jgi:hypothetical protein